jgi:glyoxylase-like metal-dependent hydrolase (beta-lactamase superfamily II)
MIFEQIMTGGDRNYAYLIGDEGTKKAAVVDPANHPKKVLARAKEQGLEVVYLINTHGHSDHTSGNKHVLSKTGARLVADGAAHNGKVYDLGEVKLEIIHTPGHTEDSLCVLAEGPGSVGKLVTGDTLFVGKVGGTGYGDDARAEYDSLHQKLMILPDDVEVWPGHNYGVEPSSTIGNERRTNPFLLRKSFEEFVDLKRNWLQYKAEHGIK